MSWIKQVYDCFYSYKLWFLTLITTNLLFIFLAWLAYPESFKSLVGLMIFFTLAIISISGFIIIRKKKLIEAAFQDFLLEPNETNEEKLCHVSPKIHWSLSVEWEAP